MKTKMNIRLRHIVLLVVVFALAAVPLAVSASHSWNGYHWARTSNPFTLKVVDSTTSPWDSYRAQTLTDWSLSSVLNLASQAGQDSSGVRWKCGAVSGKVRACNYAYGDNGWLGVARVWVYSTGHIAQGTVQVNDTYFNTPTYNTPAWRNLVMCQEVGHTLGLDHQDENFTNPNLGTCMDYTNDPSTNQHPNQHDYDQLVAIYTHLDSTTTIKNGVGGSAGAGPASGQDSEEWGAAIRADAHGRPNLVVKDLGGGARQFTWVFWTAPGKP
jgi:hypothetical protein